MKENLAEFFDRLRNLYLSKEMLYKTIEYKEGFRDCMYILSKYIKDNGSLNIILENRMLKRENSELLIKSNNQSKEITRLLNEKTTKTIQG